MLSPFWSGNRLTLGVWMTRRTACVSSQVSTVTSSKWLFDPLDVAVGNGAIRLTIQVPAGIPDGVYPFHGLTKWMANGNETLVPLVGSTGVRTMTLFPGWNLLSLPAGAPDRTALGRRFSALDGVSFLVGPAYVWDPETRNYAEVDRPLSATQGFWAYTPAARREVFVAGTLAGANLTLQPGWNLIGVGDELPVGNLLGLAKVAGAIWWWDAEAEVYRAVPPGGKLRPGTGYWVFVHGWVPVPAPVP